MKKTKGDIKVKKETSTEILKDAVKVSNENIKLAKDFRKVKLVSYTIKAVIPTMQYGNLQPEITVEAGSIEEASKTVLPYIDWLYQNYSEGTPKFLIKRAVDDKKNEAVTQSAPAGTVSPTPPSVTVNSAETTKKETPEVKKEDVSSVSEAFTKAKKAIESAMSHDALNLISDQIKKSVKLTDTEKDPLFVLLIKRIEEVNAKSTS